MTRRRDGLGVDWDNPDLDHIRDNLCRVDPNTGCWLWQHACGSDGYARARHQYTLEYVHRMLLAHRLGRPLTEQANHTCNRGHEGCINPAHLYEGDHKQNIQDAVRAGNHFGYNRRAFDRDTAREVMRLYQKGGVGYLILARQFGVSKDTIRDLVKGKTYAADTADLRA